MRPSRIAFLTLVVFVTLTGMSVGNAVAEVNRWNGFTSTTFTQGFVRTSCPGQAPCQDDDFDLSGESRAECFPVGGGSTSCVAGAYSSVSWNLDGNAGHLPGPGGDVVISTFAHLTGERVDADLFVIDGQIHDFSTDPGPVEVAVFRYSGDPTVFDGLEADSIQEVVDLGIINSDDILAVETLFNVGPFDIQVQVTGLSDEEIVIFATGDGRIPPAVPATSTAGTAVLLLVMFGLGAFWALRRRSAQAD